MAGRWCIICILDPADQSVDGCCKRGCVSVVVLIQYEVHNQGRKQQHQSRVSLTTSVQATTGTHFRYELHGQARTISKAEPVAFLSREVVPIMAQ